MIYTQYLFDNCIEFIRYNTLFDKYEVKNSNNVF